jgi:L-rhamnose mutarotase
MEMDPLKRVFCMKLKEGCKEEYEKRHREIWPEITKLLLDTGVVDYSIYFHEESNLLFAVQQRDRPPVDLSGNEVMQRWWQHMGDLMEVNPNTSPLCMPLEEIFHLQKP